MYLTLLAVKDLARVQEIDVAESGSAVYSVVVGCLVLTRNAWQRPHRTASKWQPYIEQWETMLGRGGTAIGAFEDARLVGIAVVRYRLAKSTAQLAALFVDSAYRRQGIATALVEAVIRIAPQEGAHELYVSATPSESAVGFYTSQGFALAQSVNQELYEREPEDIHLICTL